MAKTSDYRIVTFQRQPGLWRANMTPIVQPATITRGQAIRGFVTAEDSKSEEDAVIAANRAIRELDGAGLVHCRGGFAVPTRAALYFVRLWED